LRGAQSENRRPHRQEPDRAKLETDHEEQHHDAEFGEMENVLDVVERKNQADAKRTDDDAGGEIAEHRAEAKKAAERRGNGSGGEKHRHLDQLRRYHRLSWVPLASHSMQDHASPEAHVAPESDAHRFAAP
jgi:hypothetical protein